MSLNTKFHNPRWLQAPPSNNTVRVRLIDNSAKMVLGSVPFIEPLVEGHEMMNGTDCSFLVENETLGTKAVFDMGMRKDWWNLAPAVGKGLALMTTSIRVDKDVPEILQENGIRLEDIDDIFWSHAHLDHTGDPSLFPSSTTLNYGKAIAALKPGYPEQPDAPLLASDFAGRRNNEIDFGSSSLRIGGFSALDFYGDGSFYLLDTPGHAPGHISALARTTTATAGSSAAEPHGGSGKDTFLLLGGDSCHFFGVLRPNQTYPFPTGSRYPEGAIGIANSDEPQVLLQRHPEFLSPSSSSKLTATVTPWCHVSAHQHSVYEDPAAAQETANRLREEFDEAENVFVAVAHDASLFVEDGRGRFVLPTLNQTPQRDLNGWYREGWKQKLYWAWTAELGNQSESGKITPRSPLVQGFWKDGKKYETSQDLLEAVRKEKEEANV